MPANQDPRFAKALEWIAALRKELGREHVLPSGLVRLLSEALKVVESFVSPEAAVCAETPEALFLEAERILASIGGPLGSRPEVERALGILTMAIEKAKATGTPVARSYLLRSQVYDMLAKIDKNISIIQSGLEMSSSRPSAAANNQVSLFK